MVWGFDDVVAEIREKINSGTLSDSEMDESTEPTRGTHDNEAIHVALVGRPNAGKSALLNRIAGEPRVIVSERPGTTRDPVDVQVDIDKRSYILVDTAGIRKKRGAAEAAEQLSALKSLQRIERAHVVCLLIDASQSVSAQDCKIANMAVESGRALVVVFSKSDLLSDKGTWVASKATGGNS